MHHAEESRRQQTATAQAVAEEQAALDVAWQRRAELLTQLTAAERDLAAHGDRSDPTDRARAARLRARRAELEHAATGLVFGRLDHVDGTVRRIGRVGLPGWAADAEPLVIDWRAPVARPFYTATALESQGLVRRRHVRTSGATVTAVDDEPLDGAVGAGDLVGEGALLAALDERRSGRMGAAVATLQREQDAVVRADAGSPLLVQGGPGTGKTVVALHRVAYLLFAHQQVAERGVLVLGPSRQFLDYVSEVLPALGETAVVSTTCDDLLPGIRPGRTESRAVAEIKGRVLWQEALTSYVASFVPASAHLTLPVDGGEYTVDASAVAAALRASIGGAALHEGRRRAFARLVEALVEVVAEHQARVLAEMEEGFEHILGRVDAALLRDDDRPVRSAATGLDVDGALSRDDLETLRARLERDPVLRRRLESWWPRRDARQSLDALLHDEVLLRRHAPTLSADEVAVVVGEPTGGPVAPSEVALLDALAELLGDPDGAVDGGASGEAAAFTAELAGARRDWVYGHVVVDEAQELSPMQWHMVARRCPSRSVTAVGDIDQTAAPHPHRDWHDAVGAVFGGSWRRADLTICYRTPREVMDLTAAVLRRAGSRNAPPRAVRSSGVDPWQVEVDEDRLAETVAALATDLLDRYAGGSVGVVVPVVRLEEIARALAGRVPVLTSRSAKGLEWDACLVVDAAGISVEPRGWNGLYVALTRCTQELGRVVVRR